MMILAASPINDSKQIGSATTVGLGLHSMEKQSRNMNVSSTAVDAKLTLQEFSLAQERSNHFSSSIDSQTKCPKQCYPLD